jgi:hypothetical protein
MLGELCIVGVEWRDLNKGLLVKSYIAHAENYIAQDDGGNQQDDSSGGTKLPLD